jgi:hypothetical protein
MSGANADSVRAALREVHEKFAAAPGIQAVSFSWGALPLSSDDEWLFWIDGQAKPANDNDMNWALNYGRRGGLSAGYGRSLENRPLFHQAG